MPAVYNGNAANGANPNAPSITIIQDGDGLAASSVNVSTQKLADYIAALGAVVPHGLMSTQGPGTTGSLTNGSTAILGSSTVSGTTFTGSSETSGVTYDTTTGKLTVATAGRYEVMLCFQAAATTTAGQVLGQILQNGGVSAGLTVDCTVAGKLVVIPVTTQVLAAANDFFQARLMNSTGSTQTFSAGMIFSLKRISL